MSEETSKTPASDYYFGMLFHQAPTHPSELLDSDHSESKQLLEMVKVEQLKRIADALERLPVGKLTDGTPVFDLYDHAISDQ